MKSKICLPNLVLPLGLCFENESLCTSNSSLNLKQVSRLWADREEPLYVHLETDNYFNLLRTFNVKVDRP